MPRQCNHIRELFEAWQRIKSDVNEVSKSHEMIVNYVGDIEQEVLKTNVEFDGDGLKSVIYTSMTNFELICSHKRYYKSYYATLIIRNRRLKR